MQPHLKQPIIDVQNPCYCPSFPARAYIYNLHQCWALNLGTPQTSRTSRVVKSFRRLLSRAVNTPGVDPGDKGVDDSDWETSGSSSGSDTSTTTAASHSSASEEKGFGNKQTHSASKHKTATVLNTHGSSTTNGASATTTRTSEDLSSNGDYLTALNGFGRLRDSRLLICPPCKRKDSDHPSDSEDSDIRGPSKRAKSLPGTEQGSFEVRLKRESLKFDLPSSNEHLDPSGLAASPTPSLTSLNLEFLYILRTKTPTVKDPGESERLIEEIKQIAPGIRIPPDAQQPQAIARYLAENGLLTAPLLALIGKYPSIQHLSLSPSLNEHNGLNLGRVSELLPELHPPGRFAGLANLHCDFASLKDDDVVYFHNLPLRSLSLYCTGISNTAVFLLVSHRHTLLRLSIGANPRINDDAIPALLMFKRLKQLKLRGTEIKMDGLRRYASDIHREKRVINIEFSSGCCHYLNRLSSYYLVDIKPPLISECENVWRASLAELRRNLTAHSAANKDISVAGNKSELRERLIKLLQCRRDDLLVKEMLEKGNRCVVIEGGFDGVTGMSRGNSDGGATSDEYEEEDL